MIFDNEINKNEIEDLSLANFLAITNKAYNLYLNQEIEDLDITTEQIPFIIELDKKESISKKELAKYLFLNDRNTVRGLMGLYRAGIVDRKPLDKNNLDKNDFDENGINANEENKSQHDFNSNLEISLTLYGKKIASKIKEIDVEWEELIYKNLKDSNKDEIIKNVKNLAISSLKTNKDADISGIGAEVSKARKIFDKMLSRMFSIHDHKSQGSCHFNMGGHDFDDFDDFNREKIAHLREKGFREGIPDHFFGGMAYFRGKRSGERGPFFR